MARAIGPRGVGTLDQHDWHLRLDPTFLENPEIPAAAAVADNHAGQLMHAPTPGELPAGLARLADFEGHVPMRKMSPMQTDSSLKPAMVRFSPKAPYGISGMRNSSRHFG